jgi:hypothetical protein
LFLLQHFKNYIYLNLQKNNRIMDNTQIKEQQEVVKLPLIGDMAPSFRAKTTMGPLNFPEDYQRQMGNTI